MTYRTRKLALSVSLMAALAAVAMLAFVALGVAPGASAQDPPNPFATPVPDPTSMPDGEPETPFPTPASSGGGEPVSYVIEGPGFVLQERQNTTRYTINVLDEDGNPADFSQRAGSEKVTVFLDVVDTA